MTQQLGHIDSYLDFIYARHNPTHFVGRHWLIDKVAQFRDDPDRRQMVIVGEPGSGKSALLAYLAERWNLPRYFIRGDNIGSTSGLSTRAFLISIGAQLFQKYGPELFDSQTTTNVNVTTGITMGDSQVVGRFVEELYALPYLPSRVTNVRVASGLTTGSGTVIGEHIGKLIDITLGLDDWTLLHATLLDPVARLRIVRPSEIVVLLIDALDEALQDPAQKIIKVIPFEPDTPPNVRFVMTSRPGPHLSRFRVHDQLLLNDPNSAFFSNSLRDVTEYVRERITNGPLGVQWGTGKLNQVVAKIVEKSSTNFLYAFHLLNEFEAQVEQHGIDYDNPPLPSGLDEIYRFYAVQKIKADKTLVEWVEYYTPVLGILAVAREPLTRQQIAEFASVRLDYVDYIIGQINQFLMSTRNEQTTSYAIYHTSFGEYLLDRVKNADFPLNSKQYHYMIASHYKKPSSSWNEVNLAQVSDAFALRNLAYHLYWADRQQDLLTLLTGSPGWMNLRVSRGGGHSALVSDLELAMGRYTDQLEAAELLELCSLWAVRQVVNASVDSYPDIALETLTFLGRKDEALGYARLKPDAAERCKGLWAIFMAALERDEWDDNILEETLVAARSIVNTEDQAFYLDHMASVIAHKNDERAAKIFDEAMNTAESIESASEQAGAQRVIMKSLVDAGLFDRALNLLEKIKDRVTLPYARSDLASSLAKAGQYDLAMAFAKRFVEPDVQAILLNSIATAIAERRDRHSFEIFEEALAMYSGIRDASKRQEISDKINYSRAQAYARIGSKEEVLQLCQSQLGSRRAFPLTDVAAALLIAGAEREAAELVERVDDAEERAQTLVEMASLLAESNHSRVHEFCMLALNQVGNVSVGLGNSIIWRVAVILSRSGRLDDALSAVTLLRQTDQSEDRLGPVKRDIAIEAAWLSRFDEAIAIAHQIDNTNDQGYAFRKIVEALATAHHTSDALEVLQEIRNRSIRDLGARELAAFLARTGDHQAEAVFQETQDLAKDLGDDEALASALQEIANYLGQVGDARSDSMFRHALSVAKVIENSIDRFNATGEIVVRLGHVGPLAFALDIVRNLDATYIRDAGFEAIVRYVANSKNFNQALEIAASIENTEFRDRALAQVAASMCQNDECLAAIEVLKRVTQLDRRAVALAQIGAILFQAGDKRADELFDQALATSRLVASVEQHAVALAEIAVEYSKADATKTLRLFDLALSEANRINDRVERTRALEEIAINLCRVKLVEQALATLPLIKNSGRYAMIVGYIAGILTGSGDLQGALNITSEIQGPQGLSAAKWEISATLAEKGNFDQALDLARVIQDNEGRPAAMCDIATAFVKSKMFVKAFATLGLRDTSQFLKIMAEWAPNFDALDSQVGRKAITSVVTIAAWHSASWATTRDILA